MIGEIILFNLNTLCKKINMPNEVTDKIISIESTLDSNAIKIPMAKFQNRDTWMDGVKELRELLGQDTCGFKMLTCMLIAGIFTYYRYIEKNIAEEIFYDTFGCFSRFVNEHMVSYGTYGFDRDWWTCRQIAMQEFRIGELEYEMVSVEGQNVISVHIPSDTKLTKRNCLSSYRNAKVFFAKYYPQYNYDKFRCNSWLLSPNLKDVLKENSNILEFQKAFDIVGSNPEETEFMEWVFKNPNLSLDKLPANTSLQRNLKVYLKNGGKIGSAFGYLTENAFE